MDLFELMKVENPNATALVSPVGPIEIPFERYTYTVIRNKYARFAEDAKQKFSEKFASYSGCSDFLKKADDDFRNALQDVLNGLVADFISVGIMDQDADTLYDFALEEDLFDAFVESYGKILNKYEQVNGELESKKEYRQQRKDNRTQYYADSSEASSLSEMFANDADAALMNAGSAAAHTVINGIGNFFSEMAAEEELDKFFKKPELRSAITEGVYQSAFNLHYVIMAICNDHVTFDIPSDEDKEKAQRLFNNLRNGLFKDDQEMAACQEIIRLNPYQQEIYTYLLKRFDDPDGQVNDLAAFFGEDLRASKEQLALDYVKNVQGETEEDAIRAKQLLLEYAEKISLPLSGDAECVRYIDKRIEDFDRLYRTVDAVECTTREAADLAREELPALQELFASVPAPTRDSLLDYEEMVLSKREETDASFRSELKPHYLEKLDKYLADFDRLFKDVYLLRTAKTRTEAAQQRALQFVKNKSFSSIADVQNARAELQEMLPRLGITMAEAAEAEALLQKKENKLSGTGRRGLLGGLFR